MTGERDDGAYRRGDFVVLTDGDRSIDALVILAADNACSLLVAFDGIVDGCVGMMSLVGTARVRGCWQYHNVMTQKPIGVRLAGETPHTVADVREVT